MKTRKHHSRRQVRDERGCFVKKEEPRRGWQTPEEAAEGMAVLRAWALERAELAAHIEAAKKEERWGRPRSFAIFLLMSTVMLGMLAAGTLAG